MGDGVRGWKTRTVRRKIELERWNKDKIKLVGGEPWRVNPQDPNVDGEGMKLDVTVMDQQCRDQLRSQREELEKVPRNFYLKERDFERYGYTEGCPGCISLFKRGDASTGGEEDALHHDGRRGAFQQRGSKDE